MQMQNLAPWKRVSRQPAATREISVAIRAGRSEEAITERVLETLASGQADLAQSVEIAGRWPVGGLHPAARARLGASVEQENLLIRIIWQAEGASLARSEVNGWMRQIYRHVHEGEGWEYCP